MAAADVVGAVESAIVTVLNEFADIYSLKEEQTTPLKAVVESCVYIHICEVVW